MIEPERNFSGTGFAQDPRKHPEVPFGKIRRNRLPKQKVLVVDDDEFVREDIASSLAELPLTVDTASGGEEAFALFLKEGHAIVITDLKMGAGPDDGLDLLEKVKSRSQETSVIILTSFNDVPKAVQAMRMGAFDYVTKPYDATQVKLKIEMLLNQSGLASENQALKKEIADHYGIIGVSDSIRELRAEIARFAATEARVLITGPNGSGKELVARALRSQSSRAGKPFVAINCAAIPENLVESELFGTARGAFTGAMEKAGLFERAHEGTLFLDEVGELSPAAQAKLLRVLETGEFCRLGGAETISVNVRVLSATNKDLWALARENRFREDLLYRLGVLHLTTTALRERREDIPALIGHFLARNGSAREAEAVFTSEAMELLRSLEWKGNVRELANLVERLLLFRDGSRITAAQAAKCLGPAAPEAPGWLDTSRPLKAAANEFESAYIRKVIAECRGNMTEAAARLALTRTYLYEKMKALGIEPPKTDR
jgi:DNA-binding NtrC family response regulator